MELLVALVLTALVTASLYQLLLSNRRVYRQQTERVELQGNVRSAVALLPGELLELNAADTVDSDIVMAGDTSISYKAMRNLFLVCQAPVDLGATGTVIVWRNRTWGLRGIDPARDSVLVFAEGDPTTRTDNYWVHANVSGTLALGTACPGAAPSLTLSLSNVHPSGGLSDVPVGSPLRSFEVVQLFTYPDVAGDYWLGLRVYSKVTASWGAVEPVLGPVAPRGLGFQYFDSTGTVTTDRSAVARVGIRVIGRTHDPVRSSRGVLEYVVDTLATQVALRNNPR
jgi:hypothetical protein